MFLWTLLLFVRGHAAIVHPPRGAAGGRRRLHLGLPRAGAERGGDDRRLASSGCSRCRWRGSGSSSSTTLPTTARRRSSPRSTIPTSSSSAATSPMRRRARRRRSTTPTGRCASCRAASATIVVIVDADGRLDPDAPRFAAGALRRPRGRRRPVAGADLQPPDAAGLAAGRRVRRLRPPLPGRAQPLGDGGDGRQRPVQPARARSTPWPTRRARGATS